MIGRIEHACILRCAVLLTAGGVAFVLRELQRWPEVFDLQAILECCVQLVCNFSGLLYCISISMRIHLLGLVARADYSRWSARVARHRWRSRGCAKWTWGRSKSGCCAGSILNAQMSGYSFLKVRRFHDCLNRSWQSIFPFAICLHLRIGRFLALPISQNPYPFVLYIAFLQVNNLMGDVSLWWRKAIVNNKRMESMRLQSALTCPLPVIWIEWTFWRQKFSLAILCWSLERNCQLFFEYFQRSFELSLLKHFRPFIYFCSVLFMALP